jgi:AcrR family transcriptional regulator
MSLYNHVASKDDVLDGVVEAMWAEVEAAAPTVADWRAGVRGLTHAIRATVHRHPHAATLIGSRAIIPAPALRAIRDHLGAAVTAGMPEPSAYALLRTLVTYALGTAQAEVCWGGTGRTDTSSDTARRPTVANLLRPGVPDDLAAVAAVFCGQADLDTQFEHGLDLMLRGIDRA